MFVCGCVVRSDTGDAYLHGAGVWLEIFRKEQKMNKSLLVSSFAVLTASVFGMNPNYHGESSSKSSHNQLLRDVKQENLGNEHVASENR